VAIQQFLSTSFRQALTPSSLFVVTNVITQQILNGFTLENMRLKDQLMEMGYKYCNDRVRAILMEILPFFWTPL
jgi:anionic cell wall polymer biosynthesis LytR-Cps2A-Psr (LCP) family protein